MSIHDLSTRQLLTLPSPSRELRPRPVLMTRILGTPDEDNWPGVTGLPDYKSTFPQWSAVPLTSAIRGLDEHGLDLLASMLIYDPAHRMSGRFLLSNLICGNEIDGIAKRALQHPYFKGME